MRLSRRGRRPGKLAVGCESRTHTIPAGFARNTKPQPCRLFAKGAHNDSGGSKMLKYLMGAARANQPEQRCAAENLDVCLRQQAVELSRGARQSDASGVDPSMICKGPFGDGDSWTGYRPRAQGRIELCCEIWRGERKAQPQAWETEEFPKGPQHDDVAAVYFARQAGPWRPDIHERFVDGENATPGAQIVRQSQQPLFRDDAAIRIVRIDDNGEVNRAQRIDVADIHDGMPGEGRGPRMLGIGRPENARATGGHERCQQWQQDLGARRTHHMRGRWSPVGSCRDLAEPNLRRGIGQSREHVGGKGRYGIRIGIDSR